MIVHKYELHPGHGNILVNEGYQILYIGWQGDCLQLWALVEPSNKFVPVPIRVLMTGEFTVDVGKHLGSAESADGIVAHVFLLGEAP